MKNTQAGQAK